jgi:hypothetical protein
MSKGRGKDKRGRSKGELDTFFGLEVFILKTQAWQSLSPVARSIYLEIGAIFDWTNNGRLALSARQIADRMPISRATATRGFSELERKGFIAARKRSGFNMKSGERRATEWRMTRYKCNVTGDLPTKNFMAWKPGLVEVKAKYAASPNSHTSLATKPPPEHNPKIRAAVAPTRSRPAVSGVGVGLTREPLLYSAIGSSHTHSVAKAGAATPEASAVPSVNHIPSTPETFTDIHGAALKSLEELSDRLAPDFQSWAPKKLSPSKPAIPSAARAA